MIFSKRTLPFAILIGCALVAALILAFRKRVEPAAPATSAPLVRAHRAVPRDVRFVVHANGTVVPRTESNLIPQVSGEVVWVSPAMAAGGFFGAREPLLRIDRADYEANVEGTRAALARAESEYRRAAKERDRQTRLADRSVASEARIDDAENAFLVAAAAQREADANLERALRDLDRTEIRAPYDGRVRKKSVDLGQFAARGTPVGRIYAVDFAEVRLPIPDRELSYLDLPLTYRSQQPAAAPSGPEVLLRAEFAGRRHTWKGRIVRTEGELDPRSRMLHVVARVEDPYGKAAGGEDARPPLAVGLFVEAEIAGLEIPGAFALPRTALRSGNRIFIVDDEDRLRFVDVEVLRVERERVVIGRGLSGGERVCISPLRAAVEGMRVRLANTPLAATGEHS